MVVPGPVTRNQYVETEWFFPGFLLPENRSRPEDHALLQCNNPIPPHNNGECQSRTRAMSMTSAATLAIVWPRSIASLRMAW